MGCELAFRIANKNQLITVAGKFSEIRSHFRVTNDAAVRSIIVARIVLQLVTVIAAV